MRFHFGQNKKIMQFLMLRFIHIFNIKNAERLCCVVEIATIFYLFLFCI